MGSSHILWTELKLIQIVAQIIWYKKNDKDWVHIKKQESSFALFYSIVLKEKQFK